MEKLSKLDRFALAAMQSLCGVGYIKRDDRKLIVKCSYDMAELMLEESKKRNNEEPIEEDLIRKRKVR